MKKSIIPFASFILMLSVAMLSSAYTTEKSSPKQTTYFWYRVNASGQIPAGSLQFSGTKRTQSYADANDMCEGTNQDCLRGFETALSSFPSSEAGEEVTLKN